MESKAGLVIGFNENVKLHSIRYKNDYMSFIPQFCIILLVIIDKTNIGITPGYINKNDGLNK